MAISAGPARATNPINRIARVFNPRLVHVEDRVSWLDRQLSSYAVQWELPLKYAVGYRGGRITRDAPDPSVTLDLGKSVPLEFIYLVPAQKESNGDQGIFPKRFSIDISDSPDFATRTVVYTTGRLPLIHPSAGPVQFPTTAVGRYIRLVVAEGHNRGTLDEFGLSEIVAISKGEPISFGADVSAVGNLNVNGMWGSSALVDGRTPLGTWHHGVRPLSSKSKRGEIIVVKPGESLPQWKLQFSEFHPIDRIVLHPHQLERSFESSVLPEELAVDLETENGIDTVPWSNPLPGSSVTSPLVFPLREKQVKSITIRALRPFDIGDRKVCALSEIDVWSGGRNLAIGNPVVSTIGNSRREVTSLTNGYSSDNNIIPVAAWLSQLSEREKIERELGSLRPVYKHISSRSELNATWGSAIVLGLTFLIPVFVVERRRLMSRRQLDSIRKRIASDLHDDIGSNLGSISLIARTARKDLVRMQGPETIAEDLNEVENIARESSLAMRDIVWLLERSQDSIGDLVQRMNETSNRLLREMRYSLECTSAKTTARLSLDAKRHLFLFYKEAIHNILKHSHARNVGIRLWDEDDKLALEITDDGIGVASVSDTDVPGMNKLKDRARVLEGDLRIHSSRGKGTRILLLVKRSFLTATPAHP